MDSIYSNARIYLNARADRCALNGAGRGSGMVTFEGSDYTLVGFYFAPSHNGHNGMRDLFFILCQLPDKSGDVPVRPGELAREPNAGGGDGDQGLR